MNAGISATISCPERSLMSLRIWVAMLRHQNLFRHRLRRLRRRYQLVFQLDRHLLPPPRLQMRRATRQAGALR